MARVHTWEGDCAHVLPTLTDRFGTVDLAYLDPPYNVGVHGHYRDRFDDWPAFIGARLAAMTPLMAPHGVIVISVGDRELPALRHLCDTLFGRKGYLGTIHWVGGCAGNTRFVAGGVDHLVFYAADWAALHASDITFGTAKPGVADVLAAAATAWTDAAADTTGAKKALRRWWSRLPENHPALSSPGLRRYQSFDPDGRLYRTTPLDKPRPRPGHRYDLHHPSTGAVCTAPTNGWRHTWPAMQRLLLADLVHFGPDETQTPQAKTYLDQTPRAPLPALIHHRRDGAKALAQLIGPHDFPYPKDPEVLTWLFAATTGPDATILDCFAGSGTTAHAVADLDAADGGSRTVLLVTNSESHDTYLVPRMAALHNAGRVVWDQPEAPPATSAQ